MRGYYNLIKYQLNTFLWLLYEVQVSFETHEVQVFRVSPDYPFLNKVGATIGQCT